MDNSNIPQNPEPRRPAGMRRVILALIIAGAAVAALLFFVFLTAPAQNSSANTAPQSTSGDASQRLDPLAVLKSNFLGSNISAVTYGLTEGQDYSVQAVADNSNAYNFYLDVSYLNIADEQDSLIIYTDAYTETINSIEYYTSVPKNEKSAFLDALTSKMSDLTSIYGDTYETSYKKDADDQNTDSSYTYQKIYDALAADQTGIYRLNWPQTGVVTSLIIYNITGQDSYNLGVSYWYYE